MSISLVIGGARSGKSKFAEEQAFRNGIPVSYIATATAVDEEMQSRIFHHQTRRPSDWVLHECPLALTELLEIEAQKEQTILVDCLTLWLNNHLYENPKQDFSLLVSSLCDSALNA
ncbi:MAG: bifunctional adenosylcobinamide kinase/adenosylcobinamide-phosphate guanylyltransferase, partial [Cellvibrio sp.]